MGEGETGTVHIGEAARRIGKSRQTVRRLILAGRLRATRTRRPDEWTKDRHGREIPGHWRIDAASLVAYLAERNGGEESSGSATRGPSRLTRDGLD